MYRYGCNSNPQYCHYTHHHHHQINQSVVDDHTNDKRNVDDGNDGNNNIDNNTNNNDSSNDRNNIRMNKKEDNISTLAFKSIELVDIVAQSGVGNIDHLYYDTYDPSQYSNIDQCVYDKWSYYFDQCVDDSVNDNSNNSTPFSVSGQNRDDASENTAPYHNRNSDNDGDNDNNNNTTMKQQEFFHCVLYDRSCCCRYERNNNNNNNNSNSSSSSNVIDNDVRVDDSCSDNEINTLCDEGYCWVYILDQREAKRFYKWYQKCEIHLALQLKYFTMLHSSSSADTYSP
jgi:hypothetical protein